MPQLGPFVSDTHGAEDLILGALLGNVTRFGCTNDAAINRPGFTCPGFGVDSEHNKGADFTWVN
jgi:hypothetical protein